MQDLAHAANTELAAQASEWRHALDTAYTKVCVTLCHTSDIAASNNIGRSSYNLYACCSSDHH
jgi:hypothetical protein